MHWLQKFNVLKSELQEINLVHKTNSSDSTQRCNYEPEITQSEELNTRSIKESVPTDEDDIRMLFIK